MSHVRVASVALPILAPYLLERKTLIFDGKEYEYIVFSSKATAVGAPNMFVLNNNGCLGVSDTYPLRYRKIGLIHEIIEYAHGEPSSDTACVDTLKQEIIIAREYDVHMRNYLTFRRQFFIDLLTYQESQPNPPLALIKRIDHSINYLNAILC